MPAGRKRGAQDVGDTVGALDRHGFGRPLRFVARVDVALAPCELRVARREHRHEPFDQTEAAANQLRARLHQLLVEHVERAAIVGIADPRAEERVAMAQHPLEIAARGFVARRETTEQIVEVIAALRRAALHEIEVVGREHRHAQQLRADRACGVNRLRFRSTRFGPTARIATSSICRRSPSATSTRRIASSHPFVPTRGREHRETIGRDRPIRSPRARSSFRRRWRRTAR